MQTHQDMDFVHTGPDQSETTNSITRLVGFRLRSVNPRSQIEFHFSEKAVASPSMIAMRDKLSVVKLSRFDPRPQNRPFFIHLRCPESTITNAIQCRPTTVIVVADSIVCLIRDSCRCSYSQTSRRSESREEEEEAAQGH